MENPEAKIKYLKSQLDMCRRKNTRLSYELEKERSLRGDLERALQDIRNTTPEDDNPNKVKVHLSREGAAYIMARIGKESDADIAREIGVNISTVCRFRRRYGIEKYDPDGDKWSEIDPIIFTKSIRAVASQFDMDRGKIERRRKYLKGLEIQEDID